MIHDARYSVRVPRRPSVCSSFARFSFLLFCTCHGAEDPGLLRLAGRRLHELSALDICVLPFSPISACVWVCPQLVLAQASLSSLWSAGLCGPFDASEGKGLETWGLRDTVGHIALSPLCCPGNTTSASISSCSWPVCICRRSCDCPVCP